MQTGTVDDPPMCCSTGVCGPEVDPTEEPVGRDQLIALCRPPVSSGIESKLETEGRQRVGI
jgi:hypothetical protein